MRSTFAPLASPAAFDGSQQHSHCSAVPRHPSPVYYNVGTNAEQLDEFNWIYRNDPLVQGKFSWDEYVDFSSTEMLGFVVGNDPRPFFAHQAPFCPTNACSGDQWSSRLRKEA